jgi:hypothetical protein
MRKLIVLLAALAALASAGAVAAGTPAQASCPEPQPYPIVDCEQVTVGDADTATVNLHARAELSPTTAFAIGVWSSVPVAAPVTGTYAINCANNINDRAGSFVLTAGQFFSDATYLWVGSKDVAGPWFGWDVCSASVTLSQGTQGSDHALRAWLASHN